MSLPPYPTPSGQQFSGPHPGLYPLRPLGTGEILTAALRITIRHLGVLAPLAFVVAALNAAVTSGVLAATGYLRVYASGSYLDRVASPTPADSSRMLGQLGHVLLGIGAGSVVALICAPILAGVAAPFAAQAAVSRAGASSALPARLKGRWGALLGVGVVVGVAVTIGSVLLVVPGIMAWLILLPAGPVAAMEGTSLGPSLRRAGRLSKGSKGRLLGVMVLATLFAGIAAFVGGEIFGALVKSDDEVTRLLFTQGFGAIVGAFTGAFLACVTAMLYVDIRMRREGLAQALLATRP